MTPTWGCHCEERSDEAISGVGVSLVGGRRGEGYIYKLCGKAEAQMAILTRRSVLRGSLAFGAAGALARPHIANAAATTAEVWWVQGFAKEEDAAFKKMVVDYEKASGNKIDYSLIPFEPLRQKEISAITSGIVPDVM